MRLRKYQDWQYLVGENGDVYSTNYNHTGKCRRLKTFLNNKGYRWVSLYNPHTKKSESKYIHRIVAECFIKNNANKQEVNHIDGNPLNNHRSNLEWVTRSENETHKNRVLNHYKSGSKILCVDTGEVYKSIHEAGREKNVLAQNIWKVVKGRRKTCGGFRWEEIENEAI